jgi:hypothetical protein
MVVSIVLATEQGLGRLARDFYDNGIVNRVLIKHHSSRQNYYDWYEDRVSSIDDLLAGATTLLCFETPFFPEVVREAKRRGIKTVLMPMYECTTDSTANQFDVLLNPSDLDQEVFPQGVRINVPVPNSIKWKPRTRAQVFVHNAGNGGLGGRNGTAELLEAMQYVESPITLIVRTQSQDFTCSDPRVRIERGTFPFEKLYTYGDVFIFPEKFNGLSLPIQEAFASGMVVMTTKRIPNIYYLPNEPLIPVSGYTRENLARSIEVATIDPKDIARSIDALYGRDITKLSRIGKRFKQRNSWEILKSQYETVLGSSLSEEQVSLVHTL